MVKLGAYLYICEGPVALATFHSHKLIKCRRQNGGHFSHLSGDKLFVGLWPALRASRLCTSSLFHLNHHVPVISPVSALCPYRASSTWERSGRWTRKHSHCHPSLYRPSCPSSKFHQHFINALSAKCHFQRRWRLYWPSKSCANLLGGAECFWCVTVASVNTSHD